VFVSKRFGVYFTLTLPQENVARSVSEIFALAFSSELHLSSMRQIDLKLVRSTLRKDPI